MLVSLMPYLLTIGPLITLVAACHYLYENRTERHRSHGQLGQHQAAMLGLWLDQVNGRHGEDSHGTPPHWGDDRGEYRYLALYHFRVIGLWLCVVTSAGLLVWPILDAIARRPILAILVLSLMVTGVYHLSKRVSVLRTVCAAVAGLTVVGLMLGGMPESAHQAVIISLLNNVPMLYIAFARSASRTIREDAGLAAATIIWAVAHVVSVIGLMVRYDIRPSLGVLSYAEVVAKSLLAFICAAGVVFLWIRLRSRSQGMEMAVSEAVPARVQPQDPALPYSVDGKLDLRFRAQDHIEDI